MVPRRSEEVSHSTHGARSPQVWPEPNSLLFLPFLTARPAGRRALAGSDTRVALEVIAVNAASRRDPSGFYKRPLYGSGRGGRQGSRWVRKTGRQVDDRSRICGGADGVGRQIDHRWVLTSLSAQALFLSFFLSSSLFPPHCLPLWPLPSPPLAPSPSLSYPVSSFLHIVARTPISWPRILPTTQSYSHMT